MLDLVKLLYFLGFDRDQIVAIVGRLAFDTCHII